MPYDVSSSLEEKLRFPFPYGLTTLKVEDLFLWVAKDAPCKVNYRKISHWSVGSPFGDVSVDGFKIKKNRSEVRGSFMVLSGCILEFALPIYSDKRFHSLSFDSPVVVECPGESWPADYYAAVDVLRSNIERYFQR